MNTLTCSVLKLGLTLRLLHLLMATPMLRLGALIAASAVLVGSFFLSLLTRARHSDWSPTHRRQMERCDSSAGWCAGELCRKGAMEKGPEGDPVCGDRMPCRELPRGCEICPAPIFEPIASDVFDISTKVPPGLPSGTQAFGFEPDAGFAVTIKRQPTICSVLCWTFDEARQSGLGAGADSLPVYPLKCGEITAGPGHVCGNSQNDCVDLSVSTTFLAPRQFETGIVRARLFNLAMRTSSPDSVNVLHRLPFTRCNAIAAALKTVTSVRI